jgi:hypothetical protein
MLMKHVTLMGTNWETPKGKFPLLPGKSLPLQSLATVLHRKHEVFSQLPRPQALIKKFHMSHYMKGLHEVVHYRRAKGSGI